MGRDLDIKFMKLIGQPSKLKEKAEISKIRNERTDIRTDHKNI